MPGSLEEALGCLEEDHQVLLKGDVFTEDAIRMWIDYKREVPREPRVDHAGPRQALDLGKRRVLVRTSRGKGIPAP